MSPFQVVKDTLRKILQDETSNDKSQTLAISRAPSISTPTPVGTAAISPRASTETIRPRILSISAPNQHQGKVKNDQRHSPKLQKSQQDDGAITIKSSSSLHTPSPSSSREDLHDSSRDPVTLALSAKRPREVIRTTSKGVQSSSNEQSSDLLIITLSRKLWDTAYNNLKQQNELLVQEYEVVLSRLMKQYNDKDRVHIPNDGLSPNSPSPNIISQNDSNKRESQMRNFVSQWMLGSNLLTSSDPIKSAERLRKIMHRSWAMFPHASLAWAGICSASSALLNPASLTDEACDGIIGLASKMLGYMNLPRLLVTCEVKTVIKDRQLEKKIIELYRSILMFEIRILVFQENASSYNIPECLELIAHAEKSLHISGETRKELTEVLNLNKSGHNQSVSQDTIKERQQKLLDQRESNPDQDGTVLTKLNPTLIRDLYRCATSEPAYQVWAEWGKTKAEDRLLWLRGEAGRGKTTLTFAIMQAIRATTRRNNTTQDLFQVAYFFYSNERGVLPVIKSLIRQLITQQPELIKHLEEKCVSTRRKDFAYSNDFLAMSGVFFDIIMDENFSKTYIFIDGLDECLASDGWAGPNDILKLITASLHKSSKVKWLISSSSSEGILEAFSKEITECLLLNLDTKSKDISLNKGIQSILPNHVSFELSKVVQRKDYDSALQQTIKSRLLKKALLSSNFLWVSTVCRILDAEENWYAVRRLNALPTELGDLYSFMVMELRNLPRDDTEYCLSILWAMNTAQWPLYVSELAMLSGLSGDMDTNGNGATNVDTKTILAKCFAFLKIDDDSRVFFLNNEVKEHSQMAVAQGVGRSPDYNHTLLAGRCLKSLIIFFTHPGRDINSIHYALTHWIYHILEIQFPSETILNAVNDFLQNYLPEWLENVAKRSSIPTAVGLLRKLDLKIQAFLSTPSNAISLIEDAHRVFRLYESFDTPSNIHSHNTLLFCPTESPTRNSHLVSAFPSLLQAPTIGKRWTPNFLVLDGHTDWIHSMELSPNGRFIASGSSDKTVRVWDAETGATQHTMKNHEDYVRSVAISNTGIIASGSEDGTATLWDSNTGKYLCIYKDFGGYVRGLHFPPSGTKLAVATSKSLTIIDLSNGARVFAAGFKSPICCTSLSPDGRMIAAGFRDETVMVFNAAVDIISSDSTTLTVIKTLTGHEDSLSSVKFSPDSKILAASSDANITILWDTRTWKRERVLRNLGAVAGAAFFPDGSHFVSSTDESTMEIWDMKTGKPKTQIKWPGSAAKSLAVSPTGQYIVSSGHDCLIRFWYAQQQSNQEVGVPNQLTSCPTSALAISSSGQCIASGLKSGEICLWNGTTGQRIQTKHVLKHESRVNYLAFSPNGKILASVSHDKKVQLWDIKSCTLLRCFKEHLDWVRCVAFSPDGEYIASASDDRTVLIWNVNNGRLESLGKLTGHRDCCRCVAYSPNDRYIVSGGNDGQIIVWKTDTWEQFNTIESTGGSVTAVVFTPDSRRIIASLSDGNLIAWDIDTGKEQSITTPHKKSFNKLFFRKEVQDYILTEVGPLYIGDDAAKQHSIRFPYTLKYDEAEQQWWITHLGQDVIFLPKEYHPENKYTVAVLDHKVVIGCKSGQTLLFSFRNTELITEVIP